MSSPEPEYVQALDDFEALRRILPKFASERVWLRGTDPDHCSERIKQYLKPGTRIVRGVVRDRAVLALTNKACNTHASVKLLSDAGNGDDAMVLARVLLETAVLFRWLMLDQPFRLDLYCLSALLFKRRWCQLVQEHFSAYPDVLAQATESLSTDDLALIEAAFGDTDYNWARERQPDGKFRHYSIKAMVEEIEVADKSDATKDFMYDVSYFMHSAHAHNTAEAMNQFKTLGRERFFTCQLGFNRGQRATALSGASTYLSWLLGHAAAYLGLRDLEADVDQWFERVKARSSAKAQLEQAS